MAELFDKVKNILLIAVGAIILALHVVVFKMNQYMFSILMCIYIIAYTILVIVIMYKNKSCYNTQDFDILLNMSAYTMFLELFLIILVLGFMLFKKY
jgi:hypothetical protein